MRFHPSAPPPPLSRLPLPADGGLIISDRGLMEQKILHPWNPFPLQTNLHFNQLGAFVTARPALHEQPAPAPAWPPAHSGKNRAKLTFLTVVCGNDVTISHVRPLKPTLFICMFPFLRRTRRSVQGPSMPVGSRAMPSDGANQYDIISGSKKIDLSRICLLAQTQGTKAASIKIHQRENWNI